MGAAPVFDTAAAVPVTTTITVSKQGVYSKQASCHAVSYKTVLAFVNNLWGLGPEQEWGCRTGPPVLEFVNNLWGPGTE
jgi:hypothetical protein